MRLGDLISRGKSYAPKTNTIGEHLESPELSLSEGKADELHLLEVRTIANTVTAGAGAGVGSSDGITPCRVPIPTGKRAEADEIVTRIIGEKTGAGSSPDLI